MKKRTVILQILTILLILILATGSWNQVKPLPKGISIEGEIYLIQEEDIDFLYDLTYQNENKEVVLEQEIFNEVFQLVDNADEFILIDMFLFNTDYSGKKRYINLTTILKDKLIEKKRQNPNIKINFITDEINNFYGSYTSDEINELKNNNVNVIITDLTKLRDSNPLYSSFWRVFFQWFGTSGDGWITHPLGNQDKKVTARAFLKLMNTKANHRKIIIADSNGSVSSIITSANPHEASSLHSNIGIKINNFIWNDILETEKAVAKFSGSSLEIPEGLVNKEQSSQEGEIQIQLLTEGKIRDSLLDEIKSTEEGESIDLAMFYISDRKIVKELLRASERGVEIRLILDPNKDAFAREKNGIPNRQVANELVKKSNGKIKIRWYDTQGEQFHTKMIIIQKNNGTTIIILGSANYTKRNIGDYNLETDVKISASNNSNLIQEINTYFKRIWTNEDGFYTTDYSKYEGSSLLKSIQYRLQEFTGLSSF